VKKNKNNIKGLSVQEQITELSKVDLSILDNDHKSYAETGYLKVFEVSIKKGLVSPWKAIIEGFLGGFFIAMGYIGTLFATSGMADSELKTLAPFITGFVFTIAILCITFIGGSLFTSNCMGLLPVVKGNLTGKKYVSRLFLVLLGNYIGTLFAAIIVFLMGSLSKKNNTLYEGVSALFAHKVGELGVTNPNPSFKDFVIVFVHNFASAI
jgi:formate/nitrite transporter FocA (FNT family)